ncbi:hypothetical protein [Mesorhizobium sp. M0213]|uniref:hypothetical protein n=1 Tax=Mesorhizobium sp. M0213 TaxID=2956917 RepID=UPI0033372EC6
MIFSQIAGSVSSGFIDEPQDEDAQPPAFTVASNWSPNVVLRLSSEIAGADIERLRCWVNVAVQTARAMPAQRAVLVHELAFVSDSVGLLRHTFVGLPTVDKRV